MRTLAPVLLLLLAGCPSERASSDEPDCPARISRVMADLAGAQSLDLYNLVQACPDGMVKSLGDLWAQPNIDTEHARRLRSISALVRDERLSAALEAVVRDQARPIETRLEALSTLSAYLQTGRWVEFTFLKPVPDSASLRMFMGVLQQPSVKQGDRPLPADFPVRFRALLESLRDTDSSAAVRSASRRFLLFLDYSRQQQEQQKKP